MPPKYFYKLGHCKDLSIEEYFSLSGDANYNIDSHWLIGNLDLNVNLSGSLVFGGEIFGLVSKKDDWGLITIIENALDFLKKENPSAKKIGLFLPKRQQPQAIEIAKKAGFKKINLANKLPNFGSWKAVKNWIIVFEFEKEFCVGKIKTFSNQEFWANLDQNLPHKDMEQGIMNLKLARSLLNLTNKQKIWDPFCGQGRLVASGIDLKKHFFVSDILPECTTQSQINFENAQKIWQWGKKYLNIESGLNPLLNSEVLDARFLSKSRNISDFRDLAIVTEGYLGKNFQTIPTVAEVQRELSKLYEMWRQVILEVDKLKIPEVIFCLPLYLRTKENGEKWIWPKFEDKLIKQTNYSIFSFRNKKLNILYSRSDSYVGHLITKLVLV